MNGLNIEVVSSLSENINEILKAGQKISGRLNGVVLILKWSLNGVLLYQHILVIMTDYIMSCINVHTRPFCLTDRVGAILKEHETLLFIT